MELFEINQQYLQCDTFLAKIQEVDQKCHSFM